MTIKKQLFVFYVGMLSFVTGVCATQNPAPVVEQEQQQAPPTPSATPSPPAPSSTAATQAAPVVPPPPPAPPAAPTNPTPSVTPPATTPAPAAVTPPATTTPASQPEKDELTEKEKEEDKDVLDTVDTQSTSGNWVFKNYWWKKIQDVYSEIRDAFNTVMTARMTFFEQRNEIDKELDTFFQKIGMELGVLQDILEYALQVIEKEKEDKGYLDKKERAFFDKVKEKQRQLEQLREDVKAIEELDQKIDDALEVVLQQVDVCNKYMQQAWDISRDVARELSDKEARKQYYDTKGLLEDVKKVHQYFTGPFTQYFSQMGKSVHDHTRGIAAQLETLKNAGLDLKKEAHIFEAEDEELERKKADEKEARQKELERRKQKKAEGKKDSDGLLAGTVETVKQFFGSIGDYATALAISAKSFFDSIIETVKGWFFSAEEKVEQVERAVKKEIKEIEKDPQGQAYKAGKAIHSAVEDAVEYAKDKVEDAAEYVEDKAEDVVEYAQDTLREGAEYIENKARSLKEKLDDAADEAGKKVQEEEHDLLDDI